MFGAVPTKRQFDHLKAKHRTWSSQYAQSAGDGKGRTRAAAN